MQTTIQLSSHKKTLQWSPHILTSDRNHASEEAIPVSRLIQSLENSRNSRKVYILLQAESLFVRLRFEPMLLSMGNE